MVINLKKDNQQSVIKNSGKVSGMKTTQGSGSKMFPKVKKQITNITIYRHSISSILTEGTRTLFLFLSTNLNK